MNEQQADSYQVMVTQLMAEDTGEIPTPMTPAETEYRALYKEVENLMAEAQQLIDDHAIRVLEDASAAPDWEHVGDMKHVRQLAKQLVNFLSDDDI